MNVRARLVNTMALALNGQIGSSTKAKFQTYPQYSTRNLVISTPAGEFLNKSFKIFDFSVSKVLFLFFLVKRLKVYKIPI